MRDATEEVLFGWMYPDEDKRMDGLTGYIGRFLGLNLLDDPAISS